MTFAAHVAPALAWSSLIRWWMALSAMLVVWALTARRAHALFADPPRPRWITRWVDEPMFLHFAAGLVALPLLAAGAVALGAAGMAGCAPTAAPLHGAGLPRAALAAFGAGFVVAGWGLWGRRRWVKTRRIEIAMPRLHADLDGYQILHLSDLHIGSYDPRARGLEWAKLANASEPDLVVVTGDLVTSGTAYYDDVAAVIGALRAPDGVYVVLGNHDQWDDEALASALGERGVRVLRNEWVQIQRGAGALIVAGVDDAYTGKDDLSLALADRPTGLPTVLLAHYPDFFRDARERGVELTLSGHTHGGQFGVPFFADRLNLARALRQSPRGLFRRGDSTLYVNAGLGTTGPPLRIGVAPEIAVLVLRAAREG